MSTELANRLPVAPFSSWDAYDYEDGPLADIVSGRVSIVVEDAEGNRQTYAPLLDQHNTGYGVGYGGGEMFLVADEFARYYTFAEYDGEAYENFVQCVGMMLTESELKETIADFGGEEQMLLSSEYEMLDSYYGDGTGVVYVSPHIMFVSTSGCRIVDTKPID